MKIKIFKFIFVIPFISYLIFIYLPRFYTKGRTFEGITLEERVDRKLFALNQKIDKIFSKYFQNANKFYRREIPYVVDAIFHDYAMYQEYGLISKNISAFLNDKDKFIPLKNLSIKKILPSNDKQNIPKYSPFFGIRSIITKNQNNEIFLATTTWPEPNCFIALCKKYFIKLESNNNFLTYADKKNIKINWPNYFDHNKNNTIFGHSSADIDGDQQEDFILLNKVFISSQKKWLTVKGDFPTLFSSEGKGYIVTFKKNSNTLQIYSFNKIKNKFEFYKKLNLQDFKIASRAPFPINPLNSIDGKLTLLVILEDGLLSINLKNKNLIINKKLSHEVFKYPLKQNFLLGGAGDYNQDGYLDIWLSVRNYKNYGMAWLLNGKNITKKESIESEKVLFTLSNLNGFNKTASEELDRSFDGIGSSLSYFSGDFDGDDLPDFSISSHFNLSFSGSLFILRGDTISKLIANNIYKINTNNKAIIKIRGTLGSMLGSPHYHNDNYDFNKDGYSDFIISADNDGYAGFNNGSFNILSGKKIVNSKQNN